MIDTLKKSRFIPTLLSFCGMITGSLQTRAYAAAVIVSNTEPATRWNAKFDGKEGWIGGDGVYSVQLGPKRLLWIFSDTLIGSARDGKRVDTVLVNNTIGIQDGPGVDSDITFRNGITRDNKPTAVIAPSDGKGWFWPQSAVPIKGRLAIFLPRIEKTADAGAFGFKQTGLVLAMVENPADDPIQWHISRHNVPHATFEIGNQMTWGSAVLTDHEFLYIYGYDQKKQTGAAKRLLVARVPETQLEDFAAWRFRSGAGWSESPADAAPLADRVAAEFSVCPAPAGGEFILVYTENGLSDRIMGRFATSPDGPWSGAILLYRCPEMAKDNGLFSYAAKAHGWATEGNRLLISYCVNSWKFERLFQDETVYRPKFVWVELKSN